MAIISIEQLKKSYGVKTLFNGIELHINDGDKIGIVGVNGTGKSTLLKIIAGIKGADEGHIVMPKNTRVEYLSQDPQFEDNATVLEQVLKGDSKVFQVLREYEKVLEASKNNPVDTHIQSKLIKLSEDMTAANAWDLESQVKTILTRLSITNFDEKVNVLSGGQRKRVALAASLISPCDLLILDEPTNHMDSDTIEWLETYLKNRNKSLLMVTHDRYFLDRVCNRIVEISNGKAYSYEGNYTAFVTAKAERLALENRLEEKNQNLYKRELAWIRTGARARSTKQKARIQRFEEIKDREFITEEEKVDLLTGYRRMGKKTIIIEHLSKSFDEKCLFKDVKYTFLPTDRVGIIGENGAGKSTLLNVITGKLSADAGSVEIGDTIKFGYFSQESKDMDTSLRAIDYIKETAEYVVGENGYHLSASQMLERFLFVGDIQYAPIYSLSGGEQRRLYLLKILMENPNVLILDEPTNDLDIDTLKVLENYLDDFKGIVITVSHDRYFLDRICNKIFSFEGSSVIIHTGNHEDYLEYASKEGLLENKPSNTIKEKNKGLKTPPRNKPKKLKLTYKEQQELLHINEDIEALEIQLNDLQEQLEINAASYSKLQSLSEEIEAVENDLLEKMERLEYLDDKIEEIKKQKDNK